jgi:ubiquinol-cytochrome c reductase cytochrome b subunit
MFLQKDLYLFFIFLFILSYFVFFRPTAFMHPANFEQANAFVTPKSIVPEWYFLPFYTVLKSIPNKVGGILAMGFSILSLILLPVIDKKIIIKSPSSRLLWQIFFWSFICNFILLGWLGEQPADPLFVFIGQISTFYYFFSIWFILPFIGYIETFIILKKFN